MQKSSDETQDARSPYDARAVANLLLDLADERHNELTQLSLLKLIYFAQGWYLAEFKRPLIKQDFEAWQFGPVVKVVKDEFERFGSDPINCRATKLDLWSGERLIVEPKLEARDAAFVSWIFSSYNHYDAWQLSEITHEKGSPWDRIWNASTPFGRLALRIRNDDIREYFEQATQRIALS